MITTPTVSGEPGQAPRAYLALGIEGDYGSLTAGVLGLSGSTDGSLDAVVERWPFWSWLPPYFTAQADFQITDLYGHVLDGDTYGRLACASAQVGDHAASAELQVRPGPTDQPYYRNGFVVRGANGKQVVNYVDPSGEGGALSALADMSTVFYADPFGDGDWRIRTATGAAACN